ncbi:hypothetical protein F5884DRAFT_260778 [Xylogone sp. PMI_703]|nr:hypothetical protein F5884DRAFT_260778 [Xylogone sp. PMI_703]
MVSVTSVLIAAAVAFGAATATSLHVNKGCIIVNGQAICAGNPPLYVNGQVDVVACIVVSGNTAYAQCELIGNIPTNWNDVYWGEDNCLYSAGSSPILVGCAFTMGPEPVPNPY